MSPLPPPPPSGSPGPRWNPQVIGLVGLICSIFLLFSYYKILERNCVIFRVTRRNAASSQRRRLNLQEEFSSSGQLQHSRGLDSYVMHSLPITQIKDEEGAECAVCLGEFQEEEWVKHLPICSHVFHVSCIDTWFQTHSSCPLCRSYVCASMDVNLFLQTLSREDFNRQRSPQQRNSSTQVVQVRVDPHPTQ